MRQPITLKPIHAQNMRQTYLQAIEELALPFPSIPLGDWQNFNKMVGGFRTREFTIFCGPTGAGKTTFLANMSAQLLKQGVKHFVLSVETGHTDFMKRILSVLAGADLNTGDAISPDRLSRLHMANAKLLESDTIEFSLYENRVPVEQLMHDIRHMVEKNGCKIAFIDNLNFFMEVTRSSEQIIEMDRVIHELIIFCKQVDVHVVMVMHPKKTDGGRVISEFDIKGSSTAVQEAHNVFLFNRPEAEAVTSGARKHTDRELRLQKMRRRGAFVGKTIVFDSQSTKYVEQGFV
jgi:twinkle protein